MSRPMQKKGPDKVFIFGGALLLIVILLYLLIQFLSKPDCAAQFHFAEIEGGNIEPGRTIVFTDDTPGEVESRYWEFGDGLTSSEVSPQHIYEAEGIYIVTLTVNGSCSVSDTVEVMPTSEEILSVPTLPTAVIEGPTVAYEGEPVQFFDRTPNSVERVWNFADSDDLYSEQDPVHTFMVAMDYVVTLEIKGFDTARHTISIKRKKQEQQAAPKVERPAKSGGSAPTPPPPPAAPVLKPEQFTAAMKASCGNSAKFLKAIGSFFGNTTQKCMVEEPDGKVVKLNAFLNRIGSNGECGYCDNLRVSFGKDGDGMINKVILKNK